MKMYLLCVVLTVVVFGLGYFCGQTSEKHMSNSTTFDSSSSVEIAPSRTSIRSGPLQHQPVPRRAALLV